jgi:hypothetical protein
LEAYVEFLSAISEARHWSEQDEEQLVAALLRYRSARNTAFLIAGPTMNRKLHDWFAMTEKEPDDVAPWHRRPFEELRPGYNAIVNAMITELGSAIV